jgi:DNA-binding response OmpR family regulator
MSGLKHARRSGHDTASVLSRGENHRPVSEANVSQPLIVLVVEDEPLVGDIIQMSLEDGGFEVVRAVNAAAAISLLEASPDRFRAVVTDIRMPGDADGWEVGRRARELAAGIPVIYTSGDSEGEWTSKGVPNSMLVTKPFAPAQIVTALATLLNQVS